jgi:magnesium transporter
MLTRLNRRSDKAGLPPGSPVYVGEARQEPVRITLFDYSQDDFKIESQIVCRKTAVLLAG